MFGWMGSLCLFLIIPVKATRFFNEDMANSFLVGILPSILGPIGLLFLILSSPGKLSSLTLVQASLLVAFIATGLELTQLLHRPGILAAVHYTFDWFDIVASLISVFLGYIVGVILMRKKHT